MAVNKSYTRPHTEVHQFLDKAIEATGRHLTACIIGSQYDLYRVGKEAIEPTAVGEVTGNITVNYTYDKDPLTSYEVDKDSFQVVCEDILLDVTKQEQEIKGKVADDNYAKLVFKTDDDQDIIISSPDTSDLPAKFAGYSIQTGDILEFDQNGYKTLCTVKELVQATSTYDKFVGVVLDKSPVDFSQADISKEVTLKRILKQFNGVLEIVKDSVTENTVQVSKDVTIEVLGSAVSTAIYSNYGKLYPEFRVRIIPPIDEDVITVDSIEAIQEYLGTIDVQNELAYAAWCALRGSSGRELYVIRLRNEDVDGWREALRKIDADSNPYSIVPIIDGTGPFDREIIELVVQHCNEKSQPEVQMWRTAIIGVDQEGEYEVKFYNQGAASVTAYFAPAHSGETPVTLCQLSGDYSFNMLDVNGGQGKLSPGDYIEYQTIRYQVKEVLADNLVRLVEGPATATTATGIKLIKASSAANYKSYLHGLSDTISNRRAVIVWCDHGTYGGNIIPCAYIAAEIAGIQSAVLPQQSITLTEIQSVSACPRMYTRYTQKQLDEIAAGGILIVTQDNKYSAPYIRHQLTSDAANGSLYSEMSVTKNLDNISYAIADLIKGYCGRANVTTTALPRLKQAITAKLTEFTQDSVDDLTGPSLVRFYGLTVDQDPKFMDQVIVNVTYELPLPMNNIKVFQMVYRATIQMENN